VSLRRNDLEQARRQYGQALIDLREMAPGSVFLAEALPYAASLEYHLELHERAQRLMGAYECWRTTRRTDESTWGGMMWSRLGRSLVRVPPVPSDPGLVRARLDGRAMSVVAAVAYALEPVEAESAIRATTPAQPMLSSRNARTGTDHEEQY
jgi:hypothetical protein